MSGGPNEQAVHYVQQLISSVPWFGAEAYGMTVIDVRRIDDDHLDVDLEDGRTITLGIDLHPTRSHS